MRKIFQRLMFAFRWVGFLCLVGFILYVVFNIILEPISLLELVDFVLAVLAFAGCGEEKVLSAMLWLGIAYWPIKWILTGDKALFPWQTKYSWTLQKGIHASENED